MPIKRLPVDLDELTIALDSRMDEIQWFLDLQTGEVISLSHSAVRRAEKDFFGDDVDEEDDEFDDELEDEDEDEDEDVDEAGELPARVLSDWERAEAELAARVVIEAERFVDIPPTDSGEGYRMMEDFIEQVPNERVRERLWAAITGKGAFGRFKDALFNYPDVREAWFAFEARANREQAIEWLASIDVETTWEPPRGPNAPPPGID